MSPSCLDLCGDGWELFDTDAGGNDGPAGTRDAAGNDGPAGLPATVPGDVHLDLLRAGRIAEPLVARNVEERRWVEDRVWWYRRRFSVDATVAAAADRIELVCEGLDTTAAVFLNGVEVGRSNNAFVSQRFDIGTAIRGGDNELVVRLEAGPRSVAECDLAKYGGINDKLWGWRAALRKPQFTDGWDWAPHLLTCGIWRPIRIEFHRGLAVRGVVVENRLLFEEEPTDSGCYAETDLSVVAARVQINATIESLRDGPLSAEVSVSLRPLDAGGAGEDAVAAFCKRISLNPGCSELPVELEVENPLLWWPNGHGGQALYSLTITAQPEGGEAITTTRRIGIRSVRIERSSVGAEGESFVFVVNGKRVFAKGANWVPADGIPARVDYDKYRRLLSDARDAHFTMLRVWGGGIYEDEKFYSLCDEFGIMVWQDFMFACAFYADDDQGYLSQVEAEAESAILSLNHHPSIVLWCGNNENDQIYHHMTQTDWEFYKQFHPVERFFGEKIYHDILPRICARLLPNALYWPSSPFGEPGGNPNSRDCGDRHSWDNGYRNFYTDSAKFASEYGVMSFPNTATVCEYCGSPDLLPDRSDPILGYHSNEMDEKNERIASALAEYFDANADAFDTGRLILASQYFQGRTLQESFEHYRRRMFLSAGALFWMYSDSWGTAGWTVVDYSCRRKASYYHTRRGFAPTNVSIRRDGDDAVSVWLVDDGTGTGCARCVVEAIAFDGSGGTVLFDGATSSRPNGVRLAASIDLSETVRSRSRDVYLRVRIETEDGRCIHGHHFLHEDVELNLPCPDVRATISSQDGTTGTIEVVSPVFCRMVYVDEELLDWIEDNAVVLDPGEPRRIGFRCASGRRIDTPTVWSL